MSDRYSTNDNRKNRFSDGPVIGIVCEYNPFHAGHAYQIAESRRRIGEDDAPVICVMSGNFVQRGEWAILPKHERAAAAVRGGADLVVELPVPWCLSSAEGFAAGAAEILLGLGITHLGFGSECGSAEKLSEIASVLSEPSFHEKVTDYMKNHRELPYPAARSEVLASLGQDPELLSHPNDLLAAEYLKALSACGNVNFRGKQVCPVAVKRVGSAHDAVLPSEGASVRDDGSDYPSAMELRRRMRAAGMGTDSAVLETAAVSRLRFLYSQNSTAELEDAGNGVWERLMLGVASGEKTLDGICQTAKTKSISYSRLRRVAMRAVLGIGRDLTSQSPPYARILAADPRGTAYLASLRKEENGIPVVTQPKQVFALPETAQRIFAAGASADDFFALGLRTNASSAPEKDTASASPLSLGGDYRLGPVLTGLRKE